MLGNRRQTKKLTDSVNICIKYKNRKSNLWCKTSEENIVLGERARRGS